MSQEEQQSMSTELAPVTAVEDREPFSTNSQTALFSPPDDAPSPVVASPLDDKETEKVEDNDEDEDDAPWCSKRVFFPAAVPTLAGTLLGVVVAFTPLFFVFNAIDSDCTGLTGQTACESTKFSGCVWLNNTIPAAAANGWEPNSCVFPNYKDTYCPANVSQDTCVSLDGCTYNFADKECMVTHGWTAAQNGIFGGFFVLSAIFAPAVVPPVLSRFGYRVIQISMGVIVLISTLLMNIGRASSNNFGVLVASRILVGVAIGTGFVVGNTYPAEMAPKKKRKAIPSFLNFSIPTSILVVSLIGFAAQPTDLADSELKTEERIHGLTVLFWVIGVLEIIVGITMPESSAWLAAKAQAVVEVKEPASSAVDVEKGEALPSTENSKGEEDVSVVQFLKTSWKMIIVAFFLFIPAASINAVNVFAPLINNELVGVNPLMATWVFSAFGALAAPFAPIVSPRISSPKFQFVLGNLGCGTLLVISAIASMPSVGASDSTRAIIVAISLLSYVAFYQPFGGPGSFLTCIRMWEPAYISIGMSCGSMLLNVWGFLGSTIFPIMVEGISGGPDEDQKVGMSITLLILGVSSLLSAVVVQFCAVLKPSLDATS